jgi:hypothetical protein
MFITLCLVPFFCFAVYIVLLYFRPVHEDDSIFIMNKSMTEEETLKRIAYAEIMNKTSYANIKKKISLIFAAKWITPDQRMIAIEQLISLAYFNGYIRRWIVFRKAGWDMRLLFIICMGYGFVYFNMLITVIEGFRPLHPHLLMHIIISVAGFIGPVLIGMMTMGIFSIILTLLTEVFHKRGSFRKATIISEELLRALKPGGRWTPIIINPAHSKDLTSGPCR